MKIKLILVVLLVAGSCSFRRPIDSFHLNYKNENVVVKVAIDHKKKMNDYGPEDQYFYYGEMELEILKPDLKESDVPYLIAMYENQKSHIDHDSLVDYGDFWRHLNWSPNIVNKYKIYISFDGENIDTSKIYLKEVDKKFGYLPLDFYDN